MNFREIAELNPNYFEINREERNYTAILFTALCKQKNAIKFLQRCGVNADILGPDFGIYFEYSFLRDLWFQINNNEIKKQIIRNLLPIFLTFPTGWRYHKQYMTLRVARLETIKDAICSKSNVPG